MKSQESNLSCYWLFEANKNNETALFFFAGEFSEVMKLQLKKLKKDYEVNMDSG